MERQPIIKVENLSAGYSRNIVLEKVSFDVFQGEIFVVLGGSGCGKSTLLKHMIGLYCPLLGNVWIRGRSMVNASEDEKMDIMKSFGVTYQGGALFGSLTLQENVMLPQEEHTGLSLAQREQVAREKLALVELQGFEEYYPSELSGGMKKRAGLARAMALNPDLLFFDEPSAGLDPITSAELDRLILRLRKDTGATIVLVTHELDSIFAVADRCIMLDKQTRGIIAEGDPRQLRDHSENAWVRKFLTRDQLKS